MDGHLKDILPYMKDPRLGGADNFSDRLSNSYTAILLIIFGTVITTHQYAGHPISCWVPPEFTDSHTRYTNNYCWTKNTFFLPIDSEVVIPADGEPVKRIGYYQFVALVLIVQAFAFNLPRHLWIFLNKQTGVCLSTIIDTAIEIQNKRGYEERHETKLLVKKYLYNLFSDVTGHAYCEVHDKSTLKQRIRIKMSGSFLTISYIIVKLIYLINSISQLLFLNMFAGTDEFWYGVQLLRSIWYRENWHLSQTFPRVTMCDFKIRLSGNVQRHIVQCSLPINLFNEIIFVIIWFWILFVFIVTAFSFSALAYRHFRGRQYVVKKLVLLGTAENDLVGNKKEMVNRIGKFYKNFLKRDGVFLIQLIEGNTSPIIAAEILVDLLNDYISKNEKY